MHTNKIKTIIFDLGGVYFTSGTQLTLGKLHERYHIQDWGALGRFFGSEPGRPGCSLRLGRISMEEFEKRFFERFGIREKDPTILRKIWFSNYVPYHSMPQVVKTLSNDYRLVVFSGNIRERVKFLDERYDFLKHFHDSVFSYEHGYNKSDEPFYEELLNHIECAPSEALLIDDNYETIKIGKEFGFNAILFSFTEQLLKELSNYEIDIIRKI